MKVRLLYPAYISSKSSEYGMPPLGVTYLATFVKRQMPEVDITVVDAQMEGLGFGQIKNRIIKENPDFLGITVLTQMFADCVEIARIIKEANPSIKIVFGGCHINSTKDETFIYTNDVDYLVYGEGEKSLLELLTGKDKGKITGLIYKENGQVHINPPREFCQNLDELPFPDFELIENFSIGRWRVPFADRKPSIPVIATRGCPYVCSFCDIHKTNGSKFRVRSVGNVADEIQGLVKKYRARYIIFKDSTFIINRKWVMALCDELIKRKIDIHWRCNARVDLVDEELLRKMKRAGCRNISFGVESGSQRILDLLKKNTTIGQIKTAFKMVNKIGIETHASFIIASPMETKEEAKKTIELAKEIKPTFAQFGNGVAYPNTEYFDLGRQLGLIDEKWYTKTKKLYSETYLVDPSIGGEFKVDFDAEAIVKMAHREFYVRPAFLITAVKKIIRQPGFAFDLFKSGMALLGWINKKTGAKFKLPDFQLPFTSYSDPSIVYNYEGKMLKSIYERRIAICFDMMKKRYRRVLEIGAGSGVCIPSLLETADYVLGLDYHENMDKVKDTFTSRGYERFDLVRADAYKLPFSDSSFDLIIGVSVFEHLASNDKVVSECNRVLANDGEVILGIPVENAVLAGIRGIYYGIKYNVPIDHEIHAKDILNGFKRHFDIVEDRKLLPFTPFRLCFYYAARLKKRKI